VRSNLRSWLAATAFPAVPRGGSLYRHSGLDVSLSREEEGKQSPPVVEKATPNGRWLAWCMSNQDISKFELREGRVWVKECHGIRAFSLSRSLVCLVSGSVGEGDVIETSNPIDNW